MVTGVEEGLSLENRVDLKSQLYFVEERLKGFKSDDGETPLYEVGRLVSKISLLPEYVLETTYQRFARGDSEESYEKIVLDKWGRKDVESKKYIETPEIVFYRAAKLAANGFASKDSSINEGELTREIFQKFINREIFPNTPYMANGGHRILAKELLQEFNSRGLKDMGLKNDLLQELNLREQLFACFVLPIYDSRESILRETLCDAADIQASIGGTGFNFSNLRPANEAISGTGGTTDGPVRFMAAYSTVLGTTMNQGGKREGANMFMLNWNHPDVIRFIHSKTEDGEIPAANISVAIDHDFMRAFKSNGEERFYPLLNPHYNPEVRPHIKKHYTVEQLKQSLDVVAGNKKSRVSMLLSEDGKTVLSPWLPKGMDEECRKIGKVKDGLVYLDAKIIMKHLAYNAWSNGEPGGIMVGHINDANPTHPRHYRNYLIESADEEAKEIIKKIRPGNPRLNLEDLVDDYVSYKDEDGRQVNLPIGVGVMEATNPCGEKPLLPYEACVLGHTNLEEVLEEDESSSSGYKVSEEKFRESVQLMVGILDNAIDQNMFTHPKIEQTQKSNRKIGLGFMGLGKMLYRLEIGYDTQEARNFVDNLLTFWERESDEVSFERGERFGAFPNFKYSSHRNGKPKRNAITRTLAPTGTTSFVARTSGGMEPEFALVYERTTVQGTKILILNEVLEEKMNKYPFLVEEEKDGFTKYLKGNKGSLQEFQISRGQDESENGFLRRMKNLSKIKEIFVTSYDISAEAQVRMEGVVQRHVDDAISKTINFRDNATVEDVERVFLLADELKIKGVTLYRDGSRKNQPLKAGGGEKEGNSKKLEEIVDLTKVGRPEIVAGRTVRMPTPYGLNAFITLNRELDDGSVGRPYECFISVGKAGQDLHANIEGYARLISLALKKGVLPEEVYEQLEGITGETQKGIGPNAVRSLPDAIAKGIRKILESEGEGKKISNGNGLSGNLCPKCSNPLAMEEGCQKCTNIDCGFSKC